MAFSTDPAPGFNPDGDVAGQVRRQQFPIVGSGEGVWSWLHIEDAAIATANAAERGNPGIYLIANDEPLAVRQWLPAFAEWLNAPPPPQISVEEALKAVAPMRFTTAPGCERIECQVKTRTEIFSRDRWSGSLTTAGGINLPIMSDPRIAGPIANIFSAKTTKSHPRLPKSSAKWCANVPIVSVAQYWGASKLRLLLP